MSRYIRALPSSTVDLLDTTTTGSVTVGNGLTTGSIDIGNVSMTGNISMRASNWTAVNTWTPVIKAGSGSFTMDDQVGHYQQMGNIVQVNFYASYTSKNGQTGSLTIDGLGVGLNCSSLSNVTGHIDIYHLNSANHSSTSGKMFGFINSGDNVIQIYFQDEEGGTLSAMQHSDFTGGGVIKGSGWYFVD